jgi:thiamine monophosphate synthase
VSLPFDLLAITPPTGPVDPGLVDRWLAAGAGERLHVLVREPGAVPTVLLDPQGRFGALLERCRRRGLRFLISLDTNCDSASHLTEGTAGAHVRGDPSTAVLASLRPRVRGLLGRSCHGAPQPGHDLVDYTLLAPIFAPTTAQPGAPIGSKRPIGLAGLRAWTADPSAVVVALGGIDPTNAGDCFAAGAAAVAGIGVFFGPPERVEQDVAALCALRPAPHVLPPRARS